MFVSSQIFQASKLKSKNHYADCEDFDAGGIIPNVYLCQGEYPCNPCENIDVYLAMLDPEAKEEWLLMAAKLHSLQYDAVQDKDPGPKKFNLHFPGTEIAFRKLKVGYHTIQQMCGNIAEALAIKRCTNGQVGLLYCQSSCFYFCFCY